MEKLNVLDIVKNNSKKLMIRKDELISSVTPFGVIQISKARIERSVPGPEEFLVPKSYDSIKDMVHAQSFGKIRNLVMTTDDLYGGEKAALFFADYKKAIDAMIYDEEDDFYYREDDENLWEVVDEEVDDDSCSDSVRGLHQIIRLEGEESIQSGNSYALERAISDSNTFPIYVFENTEDIEKKIDAARATGSSFSVILCKKEDLLLRPMREFLAKDDALVCDIKKPEKEYFLNVVDQLLQDTGISFASGYSVRVFLADLSGVYGEDITEEQVLHHITTAVTNAWYDSRTEINRQDPELLYDSEGSNTAREQLEEMTGLENAKQVMREFAAMIREKKKNPSLAKTHNHMIFYGDPGTGKTTTAEIVGRIIQEEGIGTGVVVKADRASLIGKYVGHTAAKVSQKFNEARGGVLFVDEAGFFTQTDTGGYVKEAIKEFVRFMEVYPDVTVIFAMYERELDAFLELDEGLSSRISRYVEFKNYSGRELLDICKYMFEKNGYKLGKGTRPLIEQYLNERKRNFGNARGIRKLVEACITEKALRTYENDDDNKDFMITGADVRGAITKLSVQRREKLAKVGFSIAGSGKLVCAQCE